MMGRPEWLKRLMWPHGVRCLWFCPPWHRPGPDLPSYDEWKAGLS